MSASTDTGAAPGSFREMLSAIEAETDALTKAMDDDETPEGAPEGGDDDEEDVDDETDDEGGDEMGKAIQVTLEDGSKVPVHDATNLIKALNSKVNGQNDVLLKAVDLLRRQSKTLTRLRERDRERNLALKALETKIAEYGNTGRGRRSAVTVTDKPATTAAGTRPKAPSAEAIMAKAESLQESGKLRAIDVAVIDTALREHKPIPASLAKALGADGALMAGLG